MTIGYVTIGAHDVDAALPFFDAVLGALDWERSQPFPGWAFYGPKGGEPCLGICKPYDGEAPRAGNGIMVALKARDQAQVKAVHAAAIDAGGSDEGGPGYRPAEATSGFYAAYFRDPVGNKFCAFIAE
ncbi:VOC family protein [Phenylobacterium kunshanense]|uniref:VOC family protein n=1 Tax=Phenylobacterium kunshanense TaxID=1445034 RepID=A0A328B8S7_9CAUL|nr:VOC family protein [Phenylobacterium kunshanense]RAK63752.1 VOC family protein [Phenylobacterium kunshanense]